MAKSRAQRKAERKAREQQQAAAKQAAQAEGAQADQAKAAEAQAASESRAQHDTQVPVSGDVAEVEAVIETGAKASDYGEHTVAPTPDVPTGDEAGKQDAGEQVRLESASAPAVPGVTGGIEAAPVTPDVTPEDAGAEAEGATAAPPKPKPGKETRRQRKRREAKERKAAEEAGGGATATAEAPAREEKGAKKKRGKKAQPLPETKAEPKQRGRVIAFLVSCWAELKRVQWPDRDTLIQASAVTILFVAVVAAYLGGLDFIFSKLVELIL